MSSGLYLFVTRRTVFTCPHKYSVQIYGKCNGCLYYNDSWFKAYTSLSDSYCRKTLACNIVFAITNQTSQTLR